MVIGLIVLGFGLVFGGVVVESAMKVEAYQAQQAQFFDEASAMLEELYEDSEREIPRQAVKLEQVEALEKKLAELRRTQSAEWKSATTEKVVRLKSYIEVREKLAQYFESGILQANVKFEDVEAVKGLYDRLGESYRQPLKDKMQKMQAQYQAMIDLKNAVRDLFTDDNLTTVKREATRARYNEVVAKAEALPQRAVAENYQQNLQKVNEVLIQREREAAEARRRAEEARRRAAELRRQREQEIAGAWKVLNVPYHSQNLQQIYNGCEAASLLMALQYKGYLGGVNLHQYAEMMPKSDDYNTGFVGSIYDLQPKTYVHWIAPAPLAKFGRESSGNQKVVDVSGASLADLDREIDAGNPVVIYVTFLFNPLKEWLNGAPKNLHVVLLTGYNTKTGTHRLVDPWMQSDGGRYYDISREELEGIYNGVGKRAVVVR